MQLALGWLNRLWRDAMLVAVGLVAVAGLTYFLMKSRKETSKSTR